MRFLYCISIIFSGISTVLSLLGVSLDKGPTALTYWNIGASSEIIVIIQSMTFHRDGKGSVFVHPNPTKPYALGCK